MGSIAKWTQRVLALAVLASSGLAQTGPARANRVTAVAGQSWLIHLGRSFEETSMGKTGRLGPAALDDKKQSAEDAPLAPVAPPTTVLRGADLYRLNCRGCHGEQGSGAPPEINSVINPVRAGSATLIMARMKQSGMSITPAEAAELARQSQASLLLRLHHGGQDMPAFAHLDEVEIRALIEYLKQLAEVPGAQPDRLLVRESRVRIGEQIVKSTCHICHSASGENLDAAQLAEGAIPPLNTLTARVDQAHLIKKVTRGAPIVMGALPVLCRGRMPVFYYLSKEEVSNVYLYLTQYPPYRWATLDWALPAAPDDARAVESEPAPSVNERVSPSHAPPQDASDGPGLQFGILIAMPVTLLLTAGFAFTVRECKRLSAKGMDRRLTPVTRQLAKSGDADGTSGVRLSA